MREDFAHFFEKKQFYAWDSSVANRSMAWEVWIENKITFLEALRLMFPAWMQSRDLRGRFAEYKKVSAKRLCLFYLENDGSLYLFGKRFVVPDGDYERLIHAIRKAITEKKKSGGSAVLDAAIVKKIGENLLIPFDQYGDAPRI